jgi:archaellum biogenesis ATPase FlaH
MPHTNPDLYPVEAERLLLANAYFDADWLKVCRADLRPEHFCEPAHQSYWAAILATTEDGKAADENSVTAVLTERKQLDLVGGSVGINAISSSLYAPAPQASRWQDKVLAASRLRDFSRKAKQIAERAESGAFTLDDLRDHAAGLAELATVRKQGDTGAVEFKVRDLLAIDRTTDPNAVIGNRWLCRGGSCLIVGTTGSGKSALCTQLALGWALGQEPFGLKSRKGPLRSVILQAENDAADIAEGLQDIMRGMGIASSATGIVDQIADRVHFYREAVRTGEEFGKLIRELVLKHSADLLWVDPILAYSGINVSDQEQASHFLRHILQPVLQETGVVLMALHHTTKPKSAKDAAPTDIDSLAYAGGGSAEFANWFRAVAVLQKDPDSGDMPHYNLRLAKRGGRAGVKDPTTGDYTRSIALRHSREAGVVCWERRTPIDPSALPSETLSRPSPRLASGY